MHRCPGRRTYQYHHWHNCLAKQRQHILHRIRRPCPRNSRAWTRIPVRVDTLYTCFCCLTRNFSLRPASVPTASQPKSLAIAGDSTVFVMEINTIEAFRSNQRVFQQTPKFTSSAIAASGSTIAIGDEVCNGSFSVVARLKHSRSKDCKIHLNEWDGTILKETGVLEGNTGIVSALAFSPDGRLLASGDVSVLCFLHH